RHTRFSRDWSSDVCSSDLPLTPNGKVDRHALPAPEQTLRPANRSATEPRHPMEETVAKIWSAVLGRARIGIHDNFFELGGHSLRSEERRVGKECRSRGVCY